MSAATGGQPGSAGKGGPTSQPAALGRGEQRPANSRAFGEVEPLRQWFDSFLRDSGFVRQYPYYAAVLTRLDPIDDPGVPVMGVSAHGRRFYLHVNVDYFLRPPENARFLGGVLQHEVHHVVLGHLADPRFQDPAHPDLMELAMEMIVTHRLVVLLMPVLVIVEQIVVVVVAENVLLPILLLLYMMKHLNQFLKLKLEI